MMTSPETTRTATLYAQVTGTGLEPIASFTHQAADPATRAVRELRFDPSIALSGTELTGTVVLERPAPEGGLAVSLWSNTAYSTTTVGLPHFVTVPAGRTSTTFTARAVATDHPSIVRPSADLGTSLVTAEVFPVPHAFAVGSGGDARRDATSRLIVGIGDAPNPSGTVVSLRSDNPAVRVPAQVTVPAGQPGVTVPYEIGNVESFSVTATWNGQTASTTIYTQVATSRAR
jgi:hypothetical protein